MELLWAILIVFGIIYGCFCTNKKIVIIIYGMMLFIVNLKLIINKQVITNRYVDVSISILIFILVCFSYSIRYYSCKWLTIENQVEK